MHANQFLVGMASPVLEILLHLKFGQIPFRTMDYSPWGSKNLIKQNWLKKFMQVGVNVICMHTNFSGPGLSGFKDILLIFGQQNPFKNFMQVHASAFIPGITLKLNNSGIPNSNKLIHHNLIIIIITQVQKLIITVQTLCNNYYYQLILLFHYCRQCMVQEVFISEDTY